MLSLSDLHFELRTLLDKLSEDYVVVHFHENNYDYYQLELKENVFIGVKSNVSKN